MEDEDKDGYPDSHLAVIKIENPTRSPVSLTFDGKLMRYTILSESDYHVYRPSSQAGLLTTLTLQPEDTFKLNERISSDLSQPFSYDVSLGKADYLASESEVMTYLCLDSDDTFYNERIFGVSVFGSCYDRSIKITSEVNYQLRDSLEGQRIFVVRPNYPEFDLMYVQPNLQPSSTMEELMLFDNSGNDYEVEVVIP